MTTTAPLPDFAQICRDWSDETVAAAMGAVRHDVRDADGNLRDTTDGEDALAKAVRAEYLYRFSKCGR